MKIAALLVSVFLTAAYAQSVPCGDAPNKVSPVVTVSITRNSAGGYEYRYSVANGAASPQEISDFAIDLAKPIDNLQSPQGWSSGFFRKRSTVHWAATVPVPEPADKPDDGGIPPGLAQIKPGTSLTGFSVVSTRSPGPTVYYAKGYVPLHAYAGEQEAEVAAVQCPNSFFDWTAKGLTQGPVDFLPIKVMIKPTAKEPVPLNPGEKGVIPVAVLSGPGFDASRIDRSSVTLGSKNTHAVDKTGDLQDVDGDGNKDLILHFPAPAVGVSCGDTFLFLRGSTVDGASFGGAETIETVGCKQ